MWIDLRDAASQGYPITGVMNPLSGPYADDITTGAYQTFLEETMNIGDNAIDDGTAKPTVLRLPEGIEGRGREGCRFNMSPRLVRRVCAFGII